MKKGEINPFETINPMIYAYTTPGVKYHDGWIKIGYTERDVDQRIKEQTQTANIIANKEWTEVAVFTDGITKFTDKEFHAYLSKKGVHRKDPQEDDEGCPEWFKISAKESSNYLHEFRQNAGILETLGIIPINLRKEQKDAVSTSYNYFSQKNNNLQFLWNAKPRFGKTIASYELCKKLKAKMILILTNRPVIANSWYDDYVKFLGTSEYYFVTEVESLKKKKHVIDIKQYQLQKQLQSSEKGCIEFVSFQNLKGSIDFGGKIEKLKEIVEFEWDILIIDEAHEGVDTFKSSFAIDKIMKKYVLHLSGTPFKALANEKFNQDAIFNWTYADEQNAKKSWNQNSEFENPYENLPQLNLFTYKISDMVREKLISSHNLTNTEESEDYCWDLNEFFKTKANGEFIYDDAVDKFLDALTSKKKFPFSTEELRNQLSHTLWLLKYVSSAKALYKKLKNHEIFKDYEIVLAAGDGKVDNDGNYQDLDKKDENLKNSYDKVKTAIKTHPKTITISVGQLITGITIPEWSAVLMLSNVSSPSLYVQAAFRAQNPCLLNENKRKQNAYVFDFDPTRTLAIFEEFANGLFSDTSGGRGDADTRKQNTRKLLNFFPVYGEDEEGEMIELDVEKVLSIPRLIKAKEVVEKQFMSNFLFQNIHNIFKAPSEYFEIIKKFEPIEEPKRISGEIDTDLKLDENGDVIIPKERIWELQKDCFGEKLFYDHDEDQINLSINEFQENKEKDEKIEEKMFKEIIGNYHKITKDLVEKFKSDDNKISKSSENLLIKKINSELIDKPINNLWQEYQIETTKLENMKKEVLKEAEKSNKNSQQIIENFKDEKIKLEKSFLEQIAPASSLIKENFVTAQQMICEAFEKEAKESKKNTYLERVKNHLRGFSRTIPSFLMAYGSESTTLENFEINIPDDVFLEVTGITIEEFQKLRDGFETYDENGNLVKNNGFFDAIVFNDSVKEFLKKKDELSNYFEDDSKIDIFDYLPAQHTNQIYTPKKVVKEMVDSLEKEKPGCFDNPKYTFIDLYMKSGLYITEIVKRLFKSEKLKQLFPNKDERLKHIFENQMFGLAPTQIIYDIAMSYIFGFDKNGKISKNNFKLLDATPYAKKGTLSDKLNEIFENK